MTYTIQRDNTRSVRHLGGKITLAEVLTEEECRAIQAGKLVAISELGALMSFSSPLQDGAVIKLCPPTPEILSIFRLPD